MKERKVVGFTNGLRGEQNDLLFDVTFRDETEAEDNKIIVTVKNKDEFPEIEVTSEVDEESSSSKETENQVEFRTSVTINPEADFELDNQVESTRNITLVPEAQAPPIPLRRSIVLSPPRSSKILVPQGWPKKSIDVQQTSQVVKPKTKVPSKFDMAKQLAKIGLPSKTDKCLERWWEYRDFQDTRREAKELKREER